MLTELILLGLVATTPAEKCDALASFSCDVAEARGEGASQSAIEALVTQNNALLPAHRDQLLALIKQIYSSEKTVGQICIDAIQAGQDCKGYKENDNGE